MENLFGGVSFNDELKKIMIETIEKENEIKDVIEEKTKTINDIIGEKILEKEQQRLKEIEEAKEREIKESKEKELISLSDENKLTEKTEDLDSKNKIISSGDYNVGDIVLILGLNTTKNGVQKTILQNRRAEVVELGKRGSSLKARLLNEKTNKLQGSTISLPLDKITKV